MILQGKKMKLKVIAIISLVFTFSLQPQTVSDSVPGHKSVVQGKLPNGLKYYILPNALPERKVELRLAVLSGSLNERDDQRGLAHFTEHMLFNGTKNFPGNRVVDFLELLGMKFGPEINAYTSTEETVYMLTVPTDKPGTLDSAFLILSDWAHNATMDPDEIEKERGVVLEEMRMGKGATGRIRDKQFPVLFHNSRFAERLPIGVEEVLKNFKHETLIEYYKKWYKPELMAVIAVGDIDPAQAESFIKKYFEAIPASPEPLSRVVYKVPDHRERIYSITADPEVTTSNVVIVHKRPVLKANTITDYRQGIIHQLIGLMLNERMFDLSKTPSVPFLNAGGYSTTLSYDKGGFVLYATSKEDLIDSTFYSLLLSGEKMKRHGFTKAEFDRAVSNLSAQMDNYLKEQDNQYSEDVAYALLDQFINDAIYTDVPMGYTIFHQVMPGISLAEVNNVASSLVSDSNLVVLISYPEKEGIKNPEKTVLDKMFETVANATIVDAQKDESDAPLLTEEPVPGTIATEEEVGAFEIKKLTLSNGATVYLKKTALQQDEVLLYGFSQGGLSLIEEKDLVSAKYATDITEESGLGTFDLPAISKKLSGKMVSIGTDISGITEAVSGSSSVKDIEDMFRLIYLVFTAPRYDSAATIAYLDKLRNYLINEGMSPESIFYDSLIVAMYDRHPRMTPMSSIQLTKLDPKKAYEIFRSRFRSASDFTFIIVGNFNEEVIRDLLRRYIASQPVVDKEVWVDRGVRYNSRPVVKEIKKEIENKATVYLSYSGSFEWSRNGIILLNTLQKILDINLNEVIREELGGSYSISASLNYVKYPVPEYNFAIYFNCDPGRRDELVNRVNRLIDSLRTYNPDQVTVQKSKEIFLKEREEVFQKNGSILNLIGSYVLNNSDLRTFVDGDKIIREITLEQIRDGFKKFFEKSPDLEFYLLPKD